MNRWPARRVRKRPAVRQCLSSAQVPREPGHRYHEPLSVTAAPTSAGAATAATALWGSALWLLGVAGSGWVVRPGFGSGGRAGSCGRGYRAGRSRTGGGRARRGGRRRGRGRARGGARLSEGRCGRQERRRGQESKLCHDFLLADCRCASACPGRRPRAEGQQCSHARSSESRMLTLAAE